MIGTDKTGLAFKLLKSYARRPFQKEKADSMYMDLLEGSDSEDQVVIYLTGLVQDGLRYGNWFWSMPPAAKQVKP